MEVKGGYKKKRRNKKWSSKKLRAEDRAVLTTPGDPEKRLEASGRGPLPWGPGSSRKLQTWTEAVRG